MAEFPCKASRIEIVAKWEQHRLRRRLYITWNVVDPSLMDGRA